MSHELTLPVVGIDFANRDKSNRRSELLLLDPGAPVELVPEPRNPADGNAVAVIGPNGIQLGYLPATRAPWIGGKIRGGEEIAAIFQGVVGSAGYIRVRIGGGQPTLPPVAIADSSRQPSAEQLAEEWVPDEEGPEWGA